MRWTSFELQTPGLGPKAAAKSPLSWARLICKIWLVNLRRAQQDILNSTYLPFPIIVPAVSGNGMRAPNLNLITARNLLNLFVSASGSMLQGLIWLHRSMRLILRELKNPYRK